MLAALLALACHGPAETDTDSGDTDTDTSDTAVCEDVDGDVATAVGCAAAGGVCVSDLAACDAGTRLADHDGECAFDDGPGYCCAPPEPAATGDSCAATGGLCAPIGGCGLVDGWMTPAGDECQALYGVIGVCCAPIDTCDGKDVLTCCTEDGLTAFVPTCDRGALSCMDGSALGCEQDCPAFQ